MVRRGPGVVARAERRAALFFVAPWIIGFFVFEVYPLSMAAYYSFCDYSVLRAPVWIGTMNYAGLMSDDVFWKSLANTAIYAGLAIPFGMVVAISLALLLNSKVRGMTVYRTVFFLPSLVPTIPLAVLWLWVFNGEHGVLNALLGFLHIPGPNWLSDVNWSKPALVLMAL